MNYDDWLTLGLTEGYAVGVCALHGVYDGLTPADRARWDADAEACIPALVLRPEPADRPAAALANGR